MIVSWGRELASDMAIPSKCSNGWLEKFLGCHDFVVRKGTRKPSLPPEEIIRRAVCFVNHTHKLIQDHNVPACNIYNFDETANFFDHTNQTTIDIRGTTDIPIRSFVLEKARITVVFAANATGRKLQPCVLLRSKDANFSGIRKHDGLVQCSTPNAWMNGSTFIEYVRYIFAYHPRPLLLVFDSAPSHLSRDVKAFLHSQDILFAVIPGGLTGYLQPADVSWFKPLKNALKVEIDAWKRSGDFVYTSGNRVKAPELAVYGKWLKAAWTRVNPEIVVKSFQRCFLGSDDQLLLSKSKEMGAQFVERMHASRSGSIDIDDDLHSSVIEDFLDDFDALVIDRDDKVEQIKL
ncbi:hypothetical protein AeMF1_003413 [Aphanomyces euteiches]|nr:hypothetical protein AeMF1_003413 [Aphanomyces euteiches]KAH9194154.1 hypothetical protein AeNC1_003865 [Aphanomyces euteiches]